MKELNSYLTQIRNYDNNTIFSASIMKCNYSNDFSFK